MKIYKCIYIMRLLFLFMSIPMLCQAQLSEEAAIDWVIKNHPNILQNEHFIQQQEVLKDGRKALTPTQITYSWDEFGGDPLQFGIHSIGFQQNFNMPGVGNAFYKKQMELVKAGQARQQVTENLIRFELAKRFQLLRWLKSQEKLQSKLLENYQAFVAVADQKMKAGEAGKLPYLTAQSQYKLAQQQLSNIQQNYQATLQQLQAWLPQEQLENGVLDSLFVRLAIDKDLDLANNPQLGYAQQQVEVQQAQVAVSASQLQPQLVTSLRFQTVQGQVPFMGGQVGLSAPLFKKGYKAQIESAKLGVEVQKDQLASQQQAMQSEQAVILTQLQRAEMNLAYFEQEVTPLFEEQLSLTQKAYKTGELSYTAYLQQLQEYTKAQFQNLSYLYEHNFWALRWKWLTYSW